MKFVFLESSVFYKNFLNVCAIRLWLLYHYYWLVNFNFWIFLIFVSYSRKRFCSLSLFHHLPRSPKMFTLLKKCFMTFNKWILSGETKELKKLRNVIHFSALPDVCPQHFLFPCYAFLSSNSPMDIFSWP